jgi:glycerol uptake facilitator-like aquaporin
MVAAWIGAAYWFTASTSFANPAITIARSLSNTFSGIRPADVPGFIIAQLAGSLLALVVAQRLFQTDPATSIERVVTDPSVVTSPQGLESRADHS